jgi:predicted thioesterase
MFTALNCDRRKHSRLARRAYPRQMEVSHHTVTDADTAQRLGSGDLPVLATPRLINWIERAAFGTAAEGLEPGQTTVGTMVKVEHIKAAPVGTTVHVKGSRPVSDGRRLIFHVRVLDDTGEEVAIGEVQRAVIDRERFMRRFGCEPDGSPLPGTEDAPAS